MGEHTEDPAGESLANSDPGTDGYPPDTPGYPDSGEGVAEAPAEPAFLDLERFMEPREVARRRLFTADQPIAHDGKAGWAVERGTMNAIWIAGEAQWEVMARSPYAPRDEPGLTDVPSHGGLPAAETLIARSTPEEQYEQRRRARRVQLGLKLTPEQAEILDEASKLFGATRTTLARILVIRGAREIVDRAPREPGE